MRKKIVAGNWKMNLNTYEGISLVNDLIKEKIDLIIKQSCAAQYLLCLKKNWKIYWWSV